MHDSLHVSVYTPSNTDPEILEKIFVQRHRLLEKIVAWCEESINTTKKNHLLFIGPRGSGKTHLIAMLVNRLKNKPALQEKMIILWLGEDDVITSLVDLVLLMLESLEKTNPKRFHKDCLQQAKGQKPDTVAEIIMHSLCEQVGDATILLVKENMSDVFSGLKDIEQKKLRAFLQEKNNIAILATSQQLFQSVSSRDAAFFGFFDTYHLKILSVDDAKQLMSNIARLNKDQKLVDFLATAQGCYRTRALHHLAGGNHRLYIELAAFLTMESLDDLVSALNKLADNLTPYFQERIKSLPAQQGRIVQKLCELQGATPVKVIAEETFIGERSMAKQLGDLAKKGYVISHKRGKQSYYEMAEPLMRLILEVKNNQGSPLKMVALLLRAWFSDEELQVDQQSDKSLSADYKMAALSMDKGLLITINNKIEEQVSIGIESGDYAKVITACSEIIDSPQTDGRPLVQRANALNNRGYGYAIQNKIEQAFLDWTQVIEMEGVPDEQKAKALFNRSITYSQKGEVELLLSDLTSLIEMQDAPAELKARALLDRSVTYGQKGEEELELSDLTSLIEMQDVPAEQKAKALFNRSVTYSQKGEVEFKLSDLTSLIEMQYAPTKQKAAALFIRSITYSQEGEMELALSDLTSLIEMQDAPAEPKAKGLFIRSFIYSQNGEVELALGDLTSLIEMQDIPNDIVNRALFTVPVTYFNFLQIDKAQNALQDAFKQGDQSSEYYPSNTNDILRSINQLGSSFWQEQIVWIMSLYAQHQAIDNLCVALIQSISFFIEDEALMSSFKKWQQLWQQHGEKYQEMKLALQALQAAVLAVEQKNDKPLMVLPKEVRALVSPLLDKVLS